MFDQELNAATEIIKQALDIRPLLRHGLLGLIGSPLLVRWRPLLGGRVVRRGDS